MGAGVGAGAVVAVFLTAASVIWYSNQPASVRPWNKKAITATYVDCFRSRQGERTTFTFRYVLENHTDRDWTLPPVDALYEALSNNKGLERAATLKWDGGPVIPVGQRINVGLEIEYAYPGGADPAPAILQIFVDDRLGRIEGFAALDKVNRYDLRLPKPAGM